MSENNTLGLFVQQSTDDTNDTTVFVNTETATPEFTDNTSGEGQAAVPEIQTVAVDVQTATEDLESVVEETTPAPEIVEQTDSAATDSTQTAKTEALGVNDEAPGVNEASGVNEAPAPCETTVHANVPTPEQAKTEEPDQVDPPAPEKTNGFRTLNLAAPVVEAVERAGYFQPTDIQAQIIPHMLQRRDVLAQSQTGTGKTAGFALPVLSNLNTEKRSPQILVLAPTRELAMQVADSFSKYGQCLPGVKVAAIYGGADYSSQFRQLKGGAQIVVGTPGRVIDHIKRGSLKLEQIECLVLDEADEMLNMGFLDDVKFVLEQTPDDIQVALFSATLPKPIRIIAQHYLNDPARITIQAKTMTAESIRQRAIFVPPRGRISVLTRILEAEETDGVIVFTKTRESTVIVADKLNQSGLRAVALNGDMPQKTRERTIEQLKAGRLDILVATDVAARGLDVSRISHVFNYDLPMGTESYIHRIGRTGRAGRAGEAIIFLSSRERYRLRSIERVTKQPIEIVDPPDAETINAMRVKRFKQRLHDNAVSPDAQFFRQLLADFASESSMAWEDIAAALAVMNQNGRPFFMSADRPRKKYEDSDGSERSDRRREKFDRDKSKRGGKGRETGPPEPGMTRYRIAVGWRDGVKPGNIVGAIANEAGINGKDIGPITIHNSFTTIDLPDSTTDDALETLQQTRVVGRQMRIRRANEADSAGTRFRKGKERYGKPGRSFENKKGKKGKRVFGKKKFEGKAKKRKPK